MNWFLRIIVLRIELVIQTINLLQDVIAFEKVDPQLICIGQRHIVIILKLKRYSNETILIISGLQIKLIGLSLITFEIEKLEI